VAYKLVTPKHFCEQHGCFAGFTPMVECWCGHCMTCVGTVSFQMAIPKSSFLAIVMAVITIIIQRATASTNLSLCTLEYLCSYISLCMQELLKLQLHLGL